MDHKQCSRLRWLAVGLLAACSFVASSAWAELEAAKQDVKEIMGLDGISWEAPNVYSAANLAVTGPGGFRMELTFKAGDALFLDFAKVADKASPDGRYKYELVFTPKVASRDKALAAEARALGEDVGFLAQTSLPPRSGWFTLASGHPVDMDLPETTLKDIVHNDDVIIDGSLCVGFDCVNGESFGFDTIRLKENNLRIKFDDTSSSASFPKNDWQLTANDSANGGAEKFSIDDIGFSRTPFTIEAGAPSHSLYVDDGGRIGLGTSTPVVEVHIKDGDTPTLRLEQDGTSGFTPQTWDVAGNEAGFFVRDVTNGSQLAFRIIPGADSESLVIGANNNVGLSTDTTPDAPLHIFRSGAELPRILLDNADSAAKWFFDVSDNDDFRVSVDGSGVQEFQVTDSGSLKLGTASSCIELRDTDDAGTTACTSLNGVLSCSIGTCP